MRNWIAMFSHTGSEIVNISKIIGKKPAKVITNQKPNSKNIHPDIKTFPNVVYTKSNPTSADYDYLFEDTEHALISLHGWMRIIPGDVCKDYEIWNLHPGLISEYPELKGKDPQRRVFENNETTGGGTKEYDKVGCVIHKAVAEVDAGSIFMERSTRNNYSGQADLEAGLHGMASDMWVDFLNHKLYFHK